MCVLDEFAQLRTLVGRVGRDISSVLLTAGPFPSGTEACRFPRRMHTSTARSIIHIGCIRSLCPPQTTTVQSLSNTPTSHSRVCRNRGGRRMRRSSAFSRRGKYTSRQRPAEPCTFRFFAKRSGVFRKFSSSLLFASRRPFKPNPPASTPEANLNPKGSQSDGGGCAWPGSRSGVVPELGKLLTLRMATAVSSTSAARGSSTPDDAVIRRCIAVSKMHHRVVPPSSERCSRQVESVKVRLLWTMPSRSRKVSVSPSARGSSRLDTFLDRYSSGSLIGSLRGSVSSTMNTWTAEPKPMRPMTASVMLACEPRAASWCCRLSKKPQRDVCSSRYVTDSRMVETLDGELACGVGGGAKAAELADDRGDDGETTGGLRELR